MLMLVLLLLRLLLILRHVVLLAGVLRFLILRRLRRRLEVLVLFAVGRGWCRRVEGRRRGRGGGMMGKGSFRRRSGCIRHRGVGCLWYIRC